MSKLCRTCLSEIPDTSYVIVNTDDVKAESVQAQLSTCLPELQLNLVKDPVVCRNCLSNLELAYTFRIRCLLTEKRIQSCLRRNKLNGKRVTLAKLFSFPIQPNTESFCYAINSSEGSDLDAVRNEDSASGEHFLAEPEIASVGVQSDNVEKGRTKDHIFSTAKQDSNVVVNNDFSKVVTEEANKLGNVVTNGEITLKSTTHNLECRENVLRSSSTINGHEICRHTTPQTNEDAIIKEECEILTVKSETDEILNLKKENINDDETEIIAPLSKVSNILDITEEIPNVVPDIDAKDLFDRDYKFPYSTTENDIIEENYSSYSYDSDFDITSLADVSANTSISEHKVATVKNWNSDHEEERTNNCSTSSPRNGNNAYNVSRDKISEEMNDTEEDSIIKEECELATFKIEDEEELLHEQKFKNSAVNVDIPVKVCFINLEKLRDHLSILTKKSSFNINELRETNPAVGRNLIKNKQARTDEESFRCTICNFIATTKLTFLEHNRTHKGKKGHCCNLCDYSTPYRQNLVEHMSRHTGNKPFCCTICDYRTARKRYLVNHLRIHSDEKPFTCSVCGFSVRNKQYLTRHMRTHNKEKPFRCSTCVYSAATKTVLNRHMRIHDVKKQFHCDICEYSTAQRSNLTNHMLSHSDEKPHRCNLCEFSTAYKFSLTLHLRTHTGEKSFRCGVCGYSSAHKGSLVRHIKTHTGRKTISLRRL